MSSPQPSRSRTGRAHAEIQAAAGRVEALTRFFPGDDLEQVRSWLLAVGGSVGRLSEQLPDVEPGEGLRVIGENTRQGLQRMAHNRGRQ